MAYIMVTEWVPGVAEGQSLREYIVILPPTQLGEASTSFAVTLDI